MSETLTINTPDGAFSAYVARPKAASAPAIVVIQEIDLRREQGDARHL